MGYLDNISKEEREFLKNYNPGNYEKPSVTADIVIFTLDEDSELSILLIKRGGYPYKDHWAIPGGFMEVGKESVDETAARELFEETSIKDVRLTQLYTFSNPDRDPRMHVVSVAYTALVPREALKDMRAADDAKDIGLFKIKFDVNGIVFVGKHKSFHESLLAFDHAKIIRTAIERLRGRISYEADAFFLLKDKKSFTIYELKRIYEAVLNTKIDAGNFRKRFIRDFVQTGLVTVKDEKSSEFGKKPATLYEMDF